MIPSYQVKPVSGATAFRIRPPGSKSLTNRALLCAALAQGTSHLTGALASDDTRVMIESLKRLGVSVQSLGVSVQSLGVSVQSLGVSVNCGSPPPVPPLKVIGCGGSFPNQTSELFVGNSGTTIRFLTAALGFAGGHHRLDGTPRMRERPIGALVSALQQLGATIETLSPDGCPPVTIDSARIESGATTVRGDVSSQYLSGLLMGAPLANGDIEIAVEGKLVSAPYIAMTTQVMSEFGVEAMTPPTSSQNHIYQITSNQRYLGTTYDIEPDASAASYFWAIPAICGGQATVEGLSRNSLQGDVAFVDVLEQMGCTTEYGDDSITVTGPATHGIDIEMGPISDTVQTLAAVALFVNGPTTVRGIAHNRVKETDRIGNLAIELRKIGATVVEFEDGLTITPGPLQPAEIDTYDDHRMAMSLALVGLRQPGIVINDPDCVAKTYPHFFSDLEKVTTP